MRTHSETSPGWANLLTFGGAFPIVFAVFVICQTSLLKALVGQLGAVHLLSFALTFSLVALSISHSTSVVKAVFTPVILGIVLSSLICGVLYLEFENAVSSLIKLVYLLIIAQVSSHPLFSRALIVSADLVFLIVLAIFVFAVWGVIPSDTFETVERVKFTGGFNNPNNGPFFLHSSFLIYVAFGLWRRVILVVVVIFFSHFYLDISSNTAMLSSALIVLVWSCMKFLKLRLFSAVLSLVLVLLLIFGAVVYLLPFLTPAVLDDYVGGVLDFTLSHRIWILANEFVKSGNSLAGFVLTPIDSTYSEIIYFAGPLFFLLALVRLFSVLSFAASTNLLGIQLFLLGFLVSGLVESSLFTVTPISLFFMIFVSRGVNACLMRPKSPDVPPRISSLKV